MRAERTVIEAEKFRANIAAPDQGMELLQLLHGNQPDRNLNDQIHMGHQPQIENTQNLIPNNIPNIGVGVSDDDFFHLTCHIDPTLIHKIEKGEFVELEKLLPKERLSRTGEENRLEWVQREGGTFLVPAQKDAKISSFHRWEQAFRAYVTIYCSANPKGRKRFGSILL